MKKLKIISVALAVSLTLTAFAACGESIACGPYKEQTVTARSLTAGKGVEVDKTPIDGLFAEAYNEFAFRLFNEAAKGAIENGENLLVSPLSASACLSMIANGAAGNTRKQFESVLGGLSLEEINGYFRSLIDKTERSSLKLANSVWFNSIFPEPKESFLTDVKSYYDADVYKTIFDTDGIADLNKWCANKTNGMIPEILTEDYENQYIGYYSFLVNALYFESEWKEKYDETNVVSRDFYNADGSVTSVKMMNSIESEYFKLNGADCFVKYYKDTDYAFTAMLPAPETDIFDYISGVSAEDYAAAFNGRKYAEVYAGIPEFTDESDIDLTEILKYMGLTDAFVPYLADFSGIVDTTVLEGFYLDFVKQKTKIEVDRSGTKAAAVTIGGNKAASVAEGVDIYLDRPFVYAITETATGLPVFLGFVNNL